MAGDMTIATLDPKQPQDDCPHAPRLLQMRRHGLDLGPPQVAGMEWPDLPQRTPPCVSTAVTTRPIAPVCPPTLKIPAGEPAGRYISLSRGRLGKPRTGEYGRSSQPEQTHTTRPESAMGSPT
jgi:hypothetical protein